jgi:hypothetical protein
MKVGVNAGIREVFLKEHCGKARNRARQVIDSAAAEISALEDATR